MFSEKFFNQSYEVKNQNYGKQQGKLEHEIKKVIEKDVNNQILQENLILIEFKKQLLNLQEFNQLVKLKYLNIIQPTRVFENNTHFRIVYPDVLPYQMNKQKLEEIIKTNGINMFLLQLILTFNELNRRGIIWPLKKLDQIYLIENTIFLCLLDYSRDYNNNQNTHNNNNYLINFFCEYFKDQEKLCDIALKEGISGLEDYMLKQTNFDAINWINSPYENVLAAILNIQKFTFISQSPNSVLKEFPTTQALRVVFSPTIADNLVYKSTKFQKPELNNQITLQIDREIVNSEECSTLFYIAKCYFYFRIKQYLFLVMKKYKGSARELLESWPKQGITKEQLREEVYFFSYKFAQALNSLHKNQILHRDLKPENLLLDYMSLECGEIYICDLDRSKQLPKKYNQEVTMQFSENTVRYDPPEDPMNNPQQSFKYDIFQYGLIILEFANMGKYVGSHQGARRLEKKDFDKYYSKQSIVDKLKDIADYHKEFIDLISQCLQIAPQNRPNIHYIYEQTEKLYKPKRSQALLRIISEQQIS